METRFGTSNFELDRPLPKGKNKKVIGSMKHEIGKKAKGTKKCVIKRKLQFEDCKNCLEAAQIENKISHLEKKNKIDVDNHIKDHKEFIKTQ